MTPNERRFTNLLDALPRINAALRDVTDPELRRWSFDLLVECVDGSDPAGQAWVTNIPRSGTTSVLDRNELGFDPPITGYDPATTNSRRT